jgi:hypothetical protein
MKLLKALELLVLLPVVVISSLLCKKTLKEELKECIGYQVSDVG